MEALLDSLDSLLDDKATPNTQDAIATLVARCILAHHDSLRLAKIVVQKLGTMKMSTIHILIALVTGADGPIRNDNVLVNIGGDNIEDDQCVLLYAVDILIANISSSAYLRERLRATDGAILTRGIPSALTVPKLLGILSTIPKRTQWDDISSSVGVTLSSLMEREVTLGHYDELVNQIVDALGKIAEKAKDDAQKGVGRVCSVFGGRWRRALLERKEFKLEAFGDMLVACSRVMFAAPASMVPLTFFGALVGENVARESLTTSNAQSRTLLAVNKLIMLSLAKLKEHGKIDGPDSVFSRLSPLLMLRRVPTIYFQVAREKSRLQEADELQRCSSYLADELATRLEIGNAEDYNVDFSAQERRLSAEIAGRCLGFGELYDNVGPYGMSNSGSVFQRICSPAFTTFLSGISAKGKTTFLRSIRCARAALYAMCIHIPFLKGDEIYYEDVYRLTASFALDVISIDVDQIEQVLSNDLVQLQTGCIEFFAICVEKTLEIQLTKGSVHTKKLVEQVSEFNDQKSSSGLLTFSTFNSMVEICRAVITITQTGKCDDAWIRSGKLHFAGDVARAVTDPPLSAKTCLWNSLIVVAQRCREDTGSLRAFSTSTLSWVTAWGRKSKSDDDIHHPLCAAAALQLTFILVTRCKSLKCFAEEDGTSKQNVRQAHQWALESVKDERALNDNYANRSLRMAALKLLLAIVTVDSMDSDGSVLPSCLGPGELGKTFTVVHGLSNMDPSPDVRKLASHILGVLRHD